jgi:hypothetical protein
MQDHFDEALRAQKLGHRYQRKNPWWLVDGLARGLPGIVEGILQPMRDQRAARGNDADTIPQVLSGINDSPEFNAFAFEYDGKYILAVNYGALVLVEDLVKRLFCLPEVFPWVGNPKAEDPNRLFHPTSDNAMEYMRRFIAEPRRTDPRDPTRRKAAYVFLIMAIEFIVSHELGHILCGHVGWHQERTAGFALSEVRTPNCLEAGIDYQALEMHADGFAVWVSLLRTLGMASSREDPSVPLRVISNPVQAVEATLICALIMVGTFIGRFSAPSDWPKLTHPPLGIRHVLNVAAVARSLKHFGEPDIRAATTGNKAWNLSFGTFVLHHIWKRIGNPDWDDVLRASLGPQGVEHMEKVRRRLVELQPELDSFAHVKASEGDGLAPSGATE